MLFPINITVFFFFWTYQKSYFLSAISHGVQVPSSLPAPQSSLLSYFWLIFLIQPEFPHSLSSGCQQIPTPVPPYSSCLTSPGPRPLSLCSPGLGDMFLYSMGWKEKSKKTKNITFHPTLPRQPISLIRLVGATCGLKHESQEEQGSARPEEHLT